MTTPVPSPPGPTPLGPPLTFMERAMTLASTTWAAARADWQELPTATLTPERGQAAMWGVGVAVLCAYTTGQSFIRVGDSAVIAEIGLFAGLFALLFNGIYILPGAFRRPFALAALIALSICGGLLSTNARSMVNQVQANDDRCQLIQDDMLSAKPRKANGPELFQALGCTPTGTDRRVFVPPTDREIAAGHPLPNGGYPKPL